jgi:hypothetical protein
VLVADPVTIFQKKTKDSSETPTAAVVVSGTTYPKQKSPSTPRAFAVLKTAGARALGGGKSGAIAGVIQVISMM